MNDLISIIMATYNGEKYICQQIDSILNQTYQNFELIIGDDCSKDSTVQIAEKYAAEDKRISIIKNEKNLGFKKNFENLLNHTKGKFIALSDQDDIWTPDHLEVLIKNIGEHDLACSNAALVDADGNSMNSTMKDIMRNNDFQHDQNSIRIHLMHYNFVQGSTCLITPELVKKTLPIPENVQFHDWWIGLCAAFSKGIIYIDKPLLFYRQHGSNVTENKRWTIFDKIFSEPFKNRKYWSEQIELIETFCKNFTFNSQEDLDDAKKDLEYFKNLLNKKPLKSLPYFKKHYKAIYFASGTPLKILRIIKLFILRI